MSLDHVDLVSPALTLLTMLVGGAVVWGRFKATTDSVLAHLRAEVTRMSAAMTEMERRLVNFEKDILVRLAREEGARAERERIKEEEK